ncbi:hypothetical protein EJD97_018207, partial [Solanum chilense]
TYVGLSATSERLTTQIMNTRRAIGQRRGVAADGDNQVPPQAPAEAVAMKVNPGLRLQRTPRSLWMRCIRFWCLWGPQILRRLRWLPISSRMLHRLGARCGRIAELSAEFQEMREAKVEKFINFKKGSMTVREYSLKVVNLARIMVHVQQVEESRKRKHTRAGNTSRQAEENFSRKSITEIRDKPRFKKGLSHQGESSSSNGLYDRDSEPRVKRNNGVDTPQESPPCRKCGKLHGGECMIGTNTCYSYGKSGHMVKDCANRISQEQGKERVQPNGPSEEAPRKQ